MTELESGVDPDTLRMTVASRDAARVRVTQLRADLLWAPDETAELLTRGELVDLLGAAGEYDQALSESQQAVDRAEMVGTGAQQHLARIRLAQAHQWRAEFAASNLEFADLVRAANRYGPVIAGFTHHQAGVNAYDQGDYDAAERHFGNALALRQEFELTDQVAHSRAALAAVARRVRDAAP
ncbi:MAG: hypothetical protein M3O28_14365 [Actinomycetota bacterium]|nr:hypothetical protein [Actinomycetota bacterium]